ncbi:MAG TPA: MFS transporter [Nitrospiria bacterium]
MISGNLEGRSHLYTPTFLLLFMAHFFFGLSFWPYVLLPVFLQDLGADLLIIGVIMGASSLSGIAVRPWVGTGLDRIGRRKLLIAGGIIFLLTHFLYLRVGTIDWMVYAIRLLHGLGMGILMATFFTLAADYSPETRRTEGISFFGIAGHLSGAMGVPLGEELIRLGGYPTLFLTCAGLSLISIGLTFWIPEPPNRLFGGEPKGFFRVSLSPNLRLPFMATLAFGIGLTSYMVFLKPYANAMGIQSVTPFFIAYTLTAVGVRVIGGSWPDRFGLKPVMYPAMASMSLGIFLFVLQPTPGGLIASGIFCGIGHGYIFPILSVMVVGIEPSSNRGTLMTLYTLLFDLGLLIGAPLLGFIAKGGNYGTMYIVAGLVQLAALAVFVFSDQARERE